MTCVHDENVANYSMANLLAAFRRGSGAVLEWYWSESGTGAVPDPPYTRAPARTGVVLVPFRNRSGTGVQTRLFRGARIATRRIRSLWYWNILKDSKKNVAAFYCIVNNDTTYYYVTVSTVPNT